MQEIIKREVNQILRNRESSSNNANMIYLDDFAGTSTLSHALTISNILHQNNWIIDSGATNHMCCNLDIMKNVHEIDDVKHIYLPASSYKIVKHAGNIEITDKLTLFDVLHVPSFKYNLLSMNKPTENALIRIILYTHCCVCTTLKLVRSLQWAR